MKIRNEYVIAINQDTLAFEADEELGNNAVTRDTNPVTRIEAGKILPFAFAHADLQGTIKPVAHFRVLDYRAAQDLMAVKLAV